MADHSPETMPPSSAPLDTPGLIVGITGVFRNLLGLVINRFELAVLELSEVRTNVLKLLVLGALALFTTFFAFAYWTVLIVYLSWDALGWMILLIMAIALTAITAGIVFYAKSMLSQGKLSIPATLAELARDRDALL